MVYELLKEAWLRTMRTGDQRKNCGMADPSRNLEPRLLARARLDDLIGALRARSYRVVGPKLVDGVITNETIERAEDLPIGWTDRQEAGRYRVERRSDAAVFGYAVGPHSYKREFLPPEQKLFGIRKSKDGWEIGATPPEREKVALFGVRSCDLSAIAIQDRVLRDGAFADVHYAARRSDVFVVAVECAVAAATCFCASMEAGPDVRTAFDLALTELLEPEHAFVVRVGSTAGEEIARELELPAASDSDRERARKVVEETAAAMGRTLETKGLREGLLARPEHPRWDDVAARCLACTNCTMVCPTCFCTSVEDTTSLSGEEAQRTRRWDSCFSEDYSYIHGGPVRHSVRSRYRQWLTHKLASWWDQFGTSGCVGCGRCIAWCPAGIDITAEATAIAHTPE